MAKVLRIIGGLLAIAGGGLTTYATLSRISSLEMFPQATVTYIVTTCLGILGIVGGLLLVGNKTVGGILAMIAGILLIVGFWIPINQFFDLTTNWATLQGIGFYIDPIMAIIGGLLGLVARKK